MIELGNGQELIDLEDRAEAEEKAKAEEANAFEIKGRKISGEVESRRSGNPAPPATAAEFLEATDAILSVPGVHAIRWTQYTPYFNDGDPCEFTIHEIMVRFTPLEDESDERGDYEDGFIDSWSMSYAWERDEISELTDETYEALKKALKDWDVLYSDEVCKQNFGDHARVTATIEGFSVDYYEHD